jgi:hypothetical protein
MSYQRLGGEAPGAGSYLTQSFDDGVTWTTTKTQIAADSQLPRVAYRDSDGLYLATYQVQSVPTGWLNIHLKSTTDPADWGATAGVIGLGHNVHDSLPVVMPDGAFALFWILAGGDQFDIHVAYSVDADWWWPGEQIPVTPSNSDVEPHPLVGESSSEVELYWGRSNPGQTDYDIVREPRVVVERLYADGFDA